MSNLLGVVEYILPDFLFAKVDNFINTYISTVSPEENMKLERKRIIFEKLDSLTDNMKQNKDVFKEMMSKNLGFCKGVYYRIYPCFSEKIPPVTEEKLKIFTDKKNFIYALYSSKGTMFLDAYFHHFILPIKYYVQDIGQFKGHFDVMSNDYNNSAGFKWGITEVNELLKELNNDFKELDYNSKDTKKIVNKLIYLKQDLVNRGLVNRGFNSDVVSLKKITGKLIEMNNNFNIYITEHINNINGYISILKDPKIPLSAYENKLIKNIEVFIGELHSNNLKYKCNMFGVLKRLESSDSDLSYFINRISIIEENIPVEFLPKENIPVEFLQKENVCLEDNFF